MGFLGLGKNKAHQSSDPKEREAAVRAMPVADQGTLCEIALGDDNGHVRVAAAAKVVEREYLEMLAKHKDGNVAKIARDQLASRLMGDLRKAAWPAAKSLLAQVGEQSALLDLALQAEAAELRQAAFAKLLALPEVSQRTLATAAIQEPSGAYGLQVIERIDTKQLLKDIAKKAKADGLQQRARERITELEQEASKPSPEKQRRAMREGVAELLEPAQVLALSKRWDEAGAELDTLCDKAAAIVAAHPDVAPDETTRSHQETLERARETFRERKREAERDAEAEAANAAAKEELLAEIDGLQHADEETLAGARKRWQAIGSAGDQDAGLDRRFRDWLDRQGAEPTADEEAATAAAATGQAPIELTEEEAARIEPVLVEAEGLLQAEGTWRDRDYRFKELDKQLRTDVGHLPANHPVRQRFLDAYRAFKDARRADREARDRQRQERIEQMRGLLAEAEALAAESPTEAEVDAHLKKLQSLQGRWRAVGTVPANLLGSLRDDFRATCDRAFEPVRLRNEARDLQRQAKIPEAEALISTAQGLIEAQPDPAERHQAVKEAQAAWKKLGRLPREHNDRLWEAFKTACDAVYDSLQDWFAERDAARATAGEQKEALIVELAGIVDAGSVGIAGSIADREARVDRGARVKEIQASWKELGPAPREIDRDLWKRFKALLDKWYEAKRAEYAAKDAERTENLHRKTALCIAAEELADDAATFMGGTRIGNKSEGDFVREMKDLQREWRTIGHVPREQFAVVRERFDAAKDRLFESLEPFFAKEDESRQANLEQKQALLQEIEDLLKEERPDWFKDQARELQARWREIGPVPRSEMAINDRFREACDRIFNQAPPDEQVMMSYERGGAVPTGAATAAGRSAAEPATAGEAEASSTGQEGTDEAGSSAADASAAETGQQATAVAEDPDGAAPEAGPTAESEQADDAAAAPGNEPPVAADAPATEASADEAPAESGAEAAAPVTAPAPAAAADDPVTDETPSAAPAAAAADETPSAAPEDADQAPGDADDAAANESAERDRSS